MVPRPLRPAPADLFSVMFNCVTEPEALLEFNGVSGRFGGHAGFGAAKYPLYLLAYASYGNTMCFRLDHDGATFNQSAGQGFLDSFLRLTEVAAS